MMAHKEPHLVSANLALAERLTKNRVAKMPLVEQAFGRIQCRSCHAERLIDLHWCGLTESVAPGKVQLVSPGAAILRCRQCHGEARALFAWRSDGKDVQVAFLDGGRSVATPNSPPPVRHYLDEAASCRDVNAPSATMAMYRAALEQLLFEQGFKVRMLGPKVAALVEAVKNNTAPKWALDLDPEVLKHVKELGDGAIHPNDGDIGLQEVIDGGVIQAVEALFEQLLDVVYERPAVDAARNAKLRAAAAAMKAKPAAPPGG